MAANVSLLTMRTEVRRRANQENSLLCTDAELTTYLNYNLRKLYGAIIETDGGQYYKSATFTSTSGKDTYPLAQVVQTGDFYKLRSLDVSNGNDTVTARKYMEHERNLYKNYPYWATGWPVRYRLLGDSIRFVPVPSGAYAITLNYYPTFFALVNDTDSFDGVNGWEEYAIWKTVAYALAKEESDTSNAEAQAASILADVMQMAASRDEGEPERSMDVYAVTSGWRR